MEKKIKHGDHYHRTHEAKKKCKKKSKKIRHGDHNHRTKKAKEKCKKGGSISATKQEQQRKYNLAYVIPNLSQRHLNFLNALASPHNAYSLGGYPKPKAQDMTSQLNLLANSASQTKNIFS
jgi:hypothetical protein